MSLIEGSRAYSLDLDDTLFRRELSTRFFSSTSSQWKMRKRSTPLPEELPVLSREVAEGVLSLKERISLDRHGKRKVFPWVERVLQEASSSGVALFGNTGRPNVRSWIEMTERSLIRDGIKGLFADIFYTPADVSTTVSKAVSVQDLLARFSQVDHFDDDPITAIAIAQRFPQVRVHLIQYGRQNILFSRSERHELPNLIRVAQLYHSSTSTKL